MTIKQNIVAMAASNTLERTNQALNKSLQRLSSGNRIINPADDAAGLAVAANMRAEANRVSAARSNVANGVSYAQVQDGYLEKIGRALDRLSELAILAQDGTKTDANRALYNQEFTTIASFVTDAASKDFNGVPLFDGTDLDVPIDAEGNTFTLPGIDLNNVTYTDVTSATIDTIANAGDALSKVLAAIAQLSSDRASAGISQSRLSYAAEVLSVAKENLMAANSRISDTDIAEESTNFSRLNILTQASTSMLAQANSIPQNLLQLIRQ